MVLLGTFLLKSKSKYLSEGSSYENTKHMKSILNFSIFPKLFKKRPSNTYTTPKPKNLKVSKFPIFHLWVCVCCGCPKPFFSKIFGKFEKFRILFICLVSSYDETCVVVAPSPFFKSFWKVQKI